MQKSTLAMLLAAAATISGCEAGPASSEANGPATANDLATPAPVDAAKPRLLTTAELAHAVGPDCRKPTGSMRRGGTGKAEIYVLTCRNASLLVSVNMDGTSKFVDCKAAEVLGTPCDGNWD